MLAPRAGEAVLNAAAALTRIAEYSVRAGPTVHIRDRYFDTVEGVLGDRRFAVRVRESDGEILLTLKGEGRAESGGVGRLEVERPWSAEALSEVLSRLRAIDIPLDEGAPTLAEGPRAALAAVGLEVVQERETRRRVRSVVEADEHLAEIDIDDVTYRLVHGSPRLHEVEVEAKKPGFDLAPVVDSLLQQVPGFVPWPYSKLATGLALDEALAKGAVALTHDGAVSPDAFHELARALEGG